VFCEALWTPVKHNQNVPFGGMHNVVKVPTVGVVKPSAIGKLVLDIILPIELTQRVN